jgi:large subunit ribosomal protein L21
MKYAVIQLGGKQIKVSEGDTFEIERQDKINIDVLMFSDENGVLIGAPILEDVKVKASIVEDVMGDKVIVARFKSKSRYRKKKGHRQPLSVIKIEEITQGTKKETKSVEKPAKKTLKKAPAKVAATAKAKPVKAAAKTKTVKKVVKKEK